MSIEALIDSIQADIEYWQDRIKKSKDIDSINYYSVRIKRYNLILQALKQANAYKELLKENDALKLNFKTLEGRYKETYKKLQEVTN